jgi:hypothetical protein
MEYWKNVEKDKNVNTCVSCAAYRILLLEGVYIE